MRILLFFLSSSAFAQLSAPGSFGAPGMPGSGQYTNTSIPGGGQYVAIPGYGERPEGSYQASAGCDTDNYYRYSPTSVGTQNGVPYQMPARGGAHY